MKVLVCGASGCVGSAVTRALRSRGHRVLEGGRKGPVKIDFMQPETPASWATRLQSLDVQAVVNCVGILMPARGQRFERVHAEGPIELFRGAALAGIERIIQVSALGHAETPYLQSKHEADAALSALPLAGAVLRPSLVHGPGSQSAALFATLSALPVITLPGRGDQRVAPVHVYEIAEIVVRLLERREPVRGVFEIGGDAMSYREMLAAYRRQLGLAPALWCPLPMALMMATAWLAEALPQQVFCRDTLRLLACGNVPARNAAADLLGRAPSTLAAGLAITPPQPALDLRVTLAPAIAWALRCSLAFMWLYTALVSAALPDRSGVLALLARCGFEGHVGIAALVASCALNITLGAWALLRPAPLLYALQSAAVIGYTLTAALNMPELTLDHCGPLVKNLPVLAAVLVLWLAQPPATASTQAERRALPRRIGPLAERHQP